MKIFLILVAIASVFNGDYARGQKAMTPAGISVDIASARAVLTAITNPKLTPQEATRVAELDGNQGLVRKENSYGRPAKTSDLADALLAVAHGQPASQAFQFQFSSVKDKAPVLIALLDRIEAHPVEFRDWVLERVASFSPPANATPIAGYLIAGGASGGFAFGEPKFYLNLNSFSEFDTARVIMAHELYHAVQGVYADTRKPWWKQTLPAKSPDATLAAQCSNTASIFANLYEEGSASYVGDLLLLDGVKTPGVEKDVADFKAGLRTLHNHATLLELSITGLNAPQPVPFDDIYAIDFFVPEPLYKLGYIMAKDIDLDKGRAALTALLSAPESRFTEVYLSLPLYGKDYDHPSLGPNTVAAVERLAAGCSRTAAKPQLR